MATGTYAPEVAYQYFDNSGNVLDGGKLYFYGAGTSTPLDTYSDVGLTTPNTNPIVLNSAGRSVNAIFFTSSSYKLICKNSADVTLWTRDDIASVPATTLGVDVSVVFGEAVTSLDLLYISDGSGGQTAGRAYIASSANAYSSTTPMLGFATADGSAAATGTMRLAGGLGGFTGLTPGALYYAGTAGAITTVKPLNARLVCQAISTTAVLLSPDPPPAVPAPLALCQGRLTLTSGTPVTTTDVTAATSVYFTPFRGNLVSLYNGASWVNVTFAELSIAVPATTNQMYDIFVDYNAGTPQLVVTAWTNDTTRATALTTQDGVYVQTGNLDWRYVGSFRTTGVSGQTEDSLVKRYVWNYYNRVCRPFQKYESTDNWNYSAASWEQANASAANQADLVSGVSEDAVDVRVCATASNPANLGAASVGIGVDGTSASVSTQGIAYWNTSTTGNYIPISAHYTGIPTAGRHYYTWLERGNGTGTTTWFGDTPANLVVSGITGTWRA